MNESGHYKYPRTPHLPWSEGTDDEDKILSSIDHFENKGVVVTLKYDGENFSLYHDFLHARSADSRDHLSRHWLKAFHSQIRELIPESYRVCGENLFAKHSIYYEDLESYFYGFSIWRNDFCLDWNSTAQMFTTIGIIPVKVIYYDIFDKAKIISAYAPYKERHEGYVIRLAGSFKYNEFDKSVAKFVRKDHIQTDKHWMFSKITKNKLKEGGL